MKKSNLQVISILSFIIGFPIVIYAGMMLASGLTWASVMGAYFSGWGLIVTLVLVTIFGVILIIVGLIGLVRAWRKPETRDDGWKRNERKIWEREREKGLSSEQKVETTYLIRVEREKKDSGEETINYICGNCKSTNNLKTLNKALEQYQCLSCGANNYLKH